MMHRMTAFCFWFAFSVVVVSAGIASADIIPQSGITYDYVVQPFKDSYSDTTGNMLTDGTVATVAGGLANCVGWNSLNETINVATATFDLGQARLLDQVQVNYAIAGWGNVTGWSGWTVTLSNNSDMSSPVYTRIFGNSDLTAGANWFQCEWQDVAIDGAYWGQLGISPTQAARYVQIAGTSHMCAINPGTGTVTEGWGMISEVRFSQAVPEPCSITMLIVGTVGLLAYAWRKRK